MQRAEELMSGQEYALPSPSILDCVSKTRLAAYDAEFVVLAEQFKIKLVTTDMKIIKEVPQIALTPEHFVARYQ